jgi:hypothetical protein
MFSTESIVLWYTNVEAAKRWWIQTFDCRPAKVPEDWDEPLPSDVQLLLPGDNKPTILLSDRAEAERAGLGRPDDHRIIFANKLGKAHEFLAGRGAAPGPIQEGGGTQFFEIRDIEGHSIEICKEP